MIPSLKTLFTIIIKLYLNGSQILILKMNENLTNKLLKTKRVAKNCDKQKC